MHEGRRADSDADPLLDSAASADPAPLHAASPLRLSTAASAGPRQSQPFTPCSRIGKGESCAAHGKLSDTASGTRLTAHRLFGPSAGTCTNGPRCAMTGRCVLADAALFQASSVAERPVGAASAGLQAYLPAVRPGRHARRRRSSRYTARRQSVLGRPSLAGQSLRSSGRRTRW
jgi:hypothetical protein